MTITALPTAPLRTMPQADFDAAYAAWIAAMPTFITEANALATVLNATSGAGALIIPYTFSTTTTDSDPGTGILRLNQATQNTATVIRCDDNGSDGVDKQGIMDLISLPTAAVKGYIRLVHATDATKYLVFEVTGIADPGGYRNITVVNRASSAASPFANSDPIVWYFTPGGYLMTAVGDSAVVVHTGNGHGSTNTKIRRFTTAMTNVGSAITYADSATLGATFTINETGIYSIIYNDGEQAASGIGISRDSSQLNTGIEGIAVADRLAMEDDADARLRSLGIVERFSSGAVIRAHSGATVPSGTTDRVRFSIRKVGL